MRMHILALALVSSALMSCGQRDMDSPVDRLVGHWSSELGDNFYYSKVKTDDIGSYILVQPGGNTAHHKYKIISQVPSGERMIVQLLLSSGDKRDEKYMISKDGKELVVTTEILGMEITAKYKYVDRKIEP